MKSLLLFLCSVLLITLAPIAANADEAELSVDAGYEHAFYESSEYRFGSLFNRDSGVLSGSKLGLAYLKHAWRFDMAYRDLSGVVDYQGQNQLGIPIQSQSKLLYTQLDLSAIYHLTDIPLYLGLVGRFRKIDRHIQPTAITQGLHETLRQDEWGALFGFVWQVNQNIYVDTRVMALASTNASLSVDFLGTYEAGELSIPRSWDNQQQLAVHYQLNDSTMLSAGVTHQKFNPAASSSAYLIQNGVIVGSYSYPGSEQSIWIYALGLKLNW